MVLSLGEWCQVNLCYRENNQINKSSSFTCATSSFEDTVFFFKDCHLDLLGQLGLIGSWSQSILIHLQCIQSLCNPCWALNTWPWAILCFGTLSGCVTCVYHALCVLCNVLVVSCTCSPLIGITVRQRCFYQPCLIFIGARFVIKVPDNKASNETKTGLRPAWKLNQSYETRQRSRA